MISRLHTYTIRRTVRFIARVALLTLAILFASLLLVRAFTVSDVVVDAPGMTIELDTSRFGKNLLFLPTSSLREELLRSYPLLSDVRFEKKFPGTLVVHLVRRLTFALLTSAGNSYAIDATGLVLGAVLGEGAYPALTFDVGILSLGNRLTDARVISALSFLRALETPSSIRSMGERDSQSLYAKMEKTNIFLPQSEDLGKKAATLQIIIEGFRIKGTLPTVIDLRFEKPIITN